MKPLVQCVRRSFRAVLRGGIPIVVLLLTLESGLTQDPMTHEELMRRARGIPPAKITTNVAAPVQIPPAAPVSPVVSSSKPVTNRPVAPVVPIAVVAPRAQPEEPIPTFIPRASPAKSKGPKFSEVPPDFYEPVLPATAAAAATKAAGPTPTNAMATLDDKHVLAIGDRLSFRIVEDEEDPRPLLVADSGELEVPYIGRFAAAGKSCKELARALKAELEKEYYHRATVILAVDLMARSRGKVYLVGPVGMPGPQEIPSDEVLTLSKAILRAGGFTAFADKKTVKVTRKSTTVGDEDQTFTVNVGEILEQGRTEADLPLRPGDLVYIQERMIRF